MYRYEYEIMNKRTGERELLEGSSYKDALGYRPDIDPNEWIKIGQWRIG